MNPKLSIVLPLLVALAAPAAAGPPRTPPAAPAAAAMPLVVKPAWLAAHLADKDLVLLHVGDPAGYRKQHIAGARKVELSDISISMQGKDQLHLELPPPDDLRHRLEALGISSGSRIVVSLARPRSRSPRSRPARRRPCPASGRYWQARRRAGRDRRTASRTSRP